MPLYGVNNVFMCYCIAAFPGQSCVTKEKNPAPYALRRWTWLISNWSLANVVMRFDFGYLVLYKNMHPCVCAWVHITLCYGKCVLSFPTLCRWKIAFETLQYFSDISVKTNTEIIVVHSFSSSTLFSDLCLVLASHHGNGWKEWNWGTMSSLPYSLWQRTYCSHGSKLSKVVMVLRNF